MILRVKLYGERRGFLKGENPRREGELGTFTLEFVTCPRTEETTEQDVRQEALQGPGTRKRKTTEKEGPVDLSNPLSELPTGLVTTVRSSFPHAPREHLLETLAKRVSHSSGNPPELRAVGWCTEQG